jgi:hypothetical protein
MRHAETSLLAGPHPYYMLPDWNPFRMSTETIAADRPAAMDSLPAERRSWAAAAIFTALAMASLDTAIANIALPAIAADLHVGPADVIWVVNVYQIALVATLLPLAALGEIVGHHRIYLGGSLPPSGQPQCRRHHLAHGNLRMRIWLFPGSEHEGLDVQRTCRS